MKLHNLTVKFKHNPINKSTICLISTEAGTIEAGAKRGRKDSFNRDTGRKISLLRAMQLAKLPREQRFDEWEAYRCMTKEPRWQPTILNSRIIKKLEKDRKKQTI